MGPRCRCSAPGAGGACMGGWISVSCGEGNHAEAGTLRCVFEVGSNACCACMNTVAWLSADGRAWVPNVTTWIRAHTSFCSFGLCLSQVGFRFCTFSRWPWTFLFLRSQGWCACRFHRRTKNCRRDCLDRPSADACGSRPEVQHRSESRRCSMVNSKFTCDYCRHSVVEAERHRFRRSRRLLLAEEQGHCARSPTQFWRMIPQQCSTAISAVETKS